MYRFSRRSNWRKQDVFRCTDISSDVNIQNFLVGLHFLWSARPKKLFLLILIVLRYSQACFKEKSSADGKITFTCFELKIM